MYHICNHPDVQYALHIHSTNWVEAYFQEMLKAWHFFLFEELLTRINENETVFTFKDDILLDVERNVVSSQRNSNRNKLDTISERILYIDFSIHFHVFWNTSRNYQNLSSFVILAVHNVYSNDGIMSMDFTIKSLWRTLNGIDCSVAARQLIWASMNKMHCKYQINNRSTALPKESFNRKISINGTAGFYRIKRAALSLVGPYSVSAPNISCLMHPALVVWLLFSGIDTICGYFQAICFDPAAKGG